MFRSLVLIASLIAATYAFETGAPVGVCENMTPKHGVDPQTKPSPYTVTLSTNSIHAGDKVKVTLEGKNGERFKGFLLMARDTLNKPVGSFMVDSNDAEIQPLDCPEGKNNAVTHRNPKDKTKTSVYWTIPSDALSNSPTTVIFKATMVKNGGEFWVGQPSEPLTIHQ